MTVPPDGDPVLTRTRAGRAVAGRWPRSPAACWCWPCSAPGCATGFGPQLRLDAAVSQRALRRRPPRGCADRPARRRHRARAVRGSASSSSCRSSSWLLRRRAWWTAAWVVTAVVLIGPLTTLLKDYFGRVRPHFAEGGARLTSLSFPSGHSSGIATLVTVALVLAWPLLGRRARRHWRSPPAPLLVAARRAHPDVAGRALPDRRPRRLVAGRGLVACCTALAVRRASPAGRRAALRAERRRERARAADRAGARTTARSARCCGSPTTGWPPGAGYGGHEHRAVDVVAVVLAGALRHRWGDGAVLRGRRRRACCGPGTGLEHDEVAGDDGARVLQCYLRSADAGRRRRRTRCTGPPDGLGRPRAGPTRGCGSAAARPGEAVVVPPGLLVVRAATAWWSSSRTAARCRAPGAVLVWQLDDRPAGLGRGLNRAGALAVRESGACRPAPPTCSPPPTPTPTAPSTCAAGCTASPRSACSCRAPRRWCSRRSPGCRSR